MASASHAVLARLLGFGMTVGGPDGIRWTPRDRAAGSRMTPDGLSSRHGTGWIARSGCGPSVWVCLAHGRGQSRPAALNLCCGPVLRIHSAGVRRPRRREGSRRRPRAPGYASTPSDLLGVKPIRAQPRSFFVIVALIVTDWAFSAAFLRLCSRAMSVTLLVGQLISGFVIGTAAGVSSMVPGDLGVQEGSMAGVFRLLGVPLEQALLAAAFGRASLVISQPHAQAHTYDSYEALYRECASRSPWPF